MQKKRGAIGPMKDWYYVSFEEFEPYKIAFVEKVAESVASVTAGIGINSRTTRLLDESRKKTESLHQIEEELRQNARELRDSQENLQRRLSEAREEMQQQIIAIEAEKTKNLAILEGSVDAIIIFNQQGKVEFFNKTAEEVWGVSRTQVLKQKISTLLPLLILPLGESYEVYCNQEAEKKKIDIRTEINCSNLAGEDMTLLLTLSKAKVGKEYTFALFIQSISVELF